MGIRAVRSGQPSAIRRLRAPNQQTCERVCSNHRSANAAEFMNLAVGEGSAADDGEKQKAGSVADQD